MSTLQSDINNCQQRSRRFVRIHATHEAARKKQLEVATVTEHAALPDSLYIHDRIRRNQRWAVKAFQCLRISVSTSVSRYDAEKNGPQLKLPAMVI